MASEVAQAIGAVKAAKPPGSEDPAIASPAR
jgi:hypothetical protein